MTDDRPIYRSQGLPLRLVQFFRDNPDEELTIEIAVVKFGAKPTAVQTAIARLVESGVLESVRVVRLPARGMSRKPTPAEIMEAELERGAA